MSQPHKKKLIEVSIPLEAINAASAAEKSIRHGHPSTLHLWWARRPLAACRAILFAQLVDDPSAHPDKFPTNDEIKKERKRLFSIIEEIVKWENSSNDQIMSKALDEIRKSCGNELPHIHDPFSGGGSIPLEAQRLGLHATGSDLNPVAVTICKAMTEIPPLFKDSPPIHPKSPEQGFYKHSGGLAEDIRYYGTKVYNRARAKLNSIYPNNKSNDAITLGWIWARTVPSPDPAFSTFETPLITNFLLNAKKGQETWVEPVIDKFTGDISYTICKGRDADKIKRAKDGTKSGRGANFICLFSGAAITPKYVRQMAFDGKMNDTLIAVAVKNQIGRSFIQADDEQREAAFLGEPPWTPEGVMNTESSDLVSGRGYSITRWEQLFTNRQLVTLSTVIDLIEEISEEIKLDALRHFPENNEARLNELVASATAYGEAIVVYLGLAASRLADSLNKHCRWAPDKVQLKNMFGRQAIPMTWDYFEANPFAGASGDFLTSVTTIAKVVERFIPQTPGRVQQHDAQTIPYSKNCVISTDPPYYDNIAYADLSDFFFHWLKPAVKHIYPEIFTFLSTPKSEELVATKYRHGGKSSAEKFFLDGMTAAIKNMAQQASKEIPTTIYYAFKQSEISAEGISSTGWATFLQAVINSGYTVVGTWPLRTEMANRMVASGTNALANSVVLVCRPKAPDLEIITRSEFIRALKRELPKAINDLQTANVSPADMPQSAIGPGIGIFSRYQAVIEPNDTPMAVKTALQLVNVVLDEFLNDHHGDFDPDTRFATTWFEQHGFNRGDFGSADNLARARGISVESVKHAGIVNSSANKVRILKRDELDPDWDPNSDRHLTIWECCQHLVREYEEGGETAAAMLIKKIGYDKAEAVKELAYYLYDTCSNKRQDAKEATSYNALIAGWNDIMRMADSIHDTDTTRQSSLF